MTHPFLQTYLISSLSCTRRKLLQTWVRAGGISHGNVSAPTRDASKHANGSPGRPVRWIGRAQHQDWYQHVPLIRAINSQFKLLHVQLPFVEKKTTPSNASRTPHKNKHQKPPNSPKSSRLQKLEGEEEEEEEDEDRKSETRHLYSPPSPVESGHFHPYIRNK